MHRAWQVVHVETWKGPLEALVGPRIILTILVLMAGAGAVGGPSAAAAQETSGERYQRVGPLTVFVLPQPETEFLCRLRLPELGRTQRVLGCYLPDSQTIITTPDPHVLLHELRHHFEGSFHK